MTSRWFALADLGCAAAGGALCFAWPQAGGWPLLIALLPWAVRLASGHFPFTRTALDLPLAVFGITAGIGLWAAYDRETAWSKFWIIASALLLYYALAGQPRANLWLIAGLLGFGGALLAAFFLLKQDFRRQIYDFDILRRIALAWEFIRPTRNSNLLPYNIIGGALAVLIPFPLALGLHAWVNRRPAVAASAVVCTALIGFGLALTSSRGAWFALLVALLIWFLWEASGRYKRSRTKVFFAAVLALCALLVSWIALQKGGLAEIASRLPGLPDGVSRLDIYRGTFYLIRDFPFTGGGLASFPGLYSQYIMNIPFFLYAYSHNFFLDVALEQGLFALLALILILLASLWLIIGHPENDAPGIQAEITGTAGDSIGWLRGPLLAGLAVMALHGLVDDALFGSRGTPLIFCLPGIAAAFSSAYNPKGRIIKSSAEIPFIRFTVGPGLLGKKRRLAGLTMAALCASGLFAFMWRPVLASWYANIGAVYMAQADLGGLPAGKPSFPTGNWDASHSQVLLSSDRLQAASASFNRSLQLDPQNATAQYRLGLISYERNDFARTISYLELAHQIVPKYRGIGKILGYSYVWAGKFDQALPLLIHLPETREELDVYASWWDERGRDDLASRSTQMLVLIEKADHYH